MLPITAREMLSVWPGVEKYHNTTQAKHKVDGDDGMEQARPKGTGRGGGRGYARGGARGRGGRRGGGSFQQHNNSADYRQCSRRPAVYEDYVQWKVEKIIFYENNIETSSIKKYQTTAAIACQSIRLDGVIIPGT